MHVSFDSGTGGRQATRSARPCQQGQRRCCSRVPTVMRRQRRYSWIPPRPPMPSTLWAITSSRPCCVWVDSEERGLRSVSQRLCECGAADMHRPPLALFRGERSADCCVCGQLCQEGERKRGEREREGEGEREREGGREGEEERRREGEPERMRGEKARGRGEEAGRKRGIGRGGK